MDLVRIMAVAKKELLQIRRDPLSLALAFVLPIVLLVIFGYAITFDVRSITTVLCDQDRTLQSRQYVAALAQSGYFTVVASVDAEQEINSWLDAGKAEVALVIPAGFSRDLADRRGAAIAAIVDGSDSNTATIALGYLDAVNAQYNRALTRAGPPAVDVRSRVWYNPELKSRNFIIPGLIVMIMAIIVSLLTSLTISREWERGTMEQLIATPVRPAEVIVGKLLPYFAIGFGDTALAVAMGSLLFSVPIRGSLVLLFALAALFIAGGLSFGILLSIVGRTQLVSSQMAMLSTFLPVFLLSGFVFAIANMPRPLQLLTYLVQARYFVTIAKGIFLKGSGFRLLAGDAALLAVYAVVVFAVAVRKFRKKVA